MRFGYLAAAAAAVIGATQASAAVFIYDSRADFVAAATSTVRTEDFNAFPDTETTGSLRFSNTTFYSPSRTSVDDGSFCIEGQGKCLFAATLEPVRSFSTADDSTTGFAADFASFRPTDLIRVAVRDYFGTTTNYSFIVGSGFFGIKDTNGIVQIDFQNLGSTTPDSVGLGNYSFDNVSTFTGNIVLPVPEPATWAMMMFGVGAIGAAMRRRPSRRLAAA